MFIVSCETKQIIARRLEGARADSIAMSAASPGPCADECRKQMFIHRRKRK